MRPKSLILLMLALGCGLVASIGVNQVMAKRNVVTTTHEETTPIFVAGSSIGIGDPLKVDQLKLVEWPKAKLPQGSLGKLEEIEGRRARTNIFAGEPILEAKLFAKGDSGETATDLIPKGFRVVAIQVDAEKTGGNLIRPGDRVDVLVHLAENASNGIAKTSTRTFIQNVKVFAVDNVYHPDKNGTEAATGKTVSLLVTPTQAELVTLAAELGQIRLVLRSATDEQNDTTEGVTADHLLSGGSISPSPTPTAPPPVAPTAMSLLGLLGQQSKSDEPEDETELEPEPEPTWRMVLLLGDEMKEVEIPEEGPKVGLTQSSSKSLHLTGDKNDPTKPIFPDDADGGDAEPASNVAPVSEE